MKNYLLVVSMVLFTKYSENSNQKNDIHENEKFENSSSHTYPDIYGIRKKNTNGNNTEVHVLEGRTNYDTIKLHVKTGLTETKGDVEFCLADYNKDGIQDILVIKKYFTKTKSTEILVLDGGSRFQRVLLNTGTVLNETGNNFEFCAADYNGDGYTDLWAIKKSNTGTNSTEIHILNGKNNFQDFLLQTGSILHEVVSDFEFEVGDYNKDGKMDLWAIKKKATESNTVEINILSGKKNFQSFLLRTGSALHENSKDFEFIVANFNSDRRKDLVAIRKSNPARIYVLDGSRKFKTFLAQTETALKTTDNDDVFLMGLPIGFF